MLLELINDSTKERITKEGTYLQSPTVPTKEFIYNNSLYTVHKVIPYVYDKYSKELPTHQVHCLESKTNAVGFVDFVSSNPYKQAPVLSSDSFDVKPA